MMNIPNSHFRIHRVANEGPCAIQNMRRCLLRRRVICCAKSHESHVKRLAVFVSGTGSNFRRIHESCATKKIKGEVVLLVTNNPDCPAAEFASDNAIPMLRYPSKKNETLWSPRSLVDIVKNEYRVDFILLAGYLKLIPSELIKVYPRAILNIHPALLPAFGGKGFYGRSVHKAVLESGTKYSGATVHFVSEGYDRGVILDQRVVPVLQNDTPETLAQRVLRQVY